MGKRYRSTPNVFGGGFSTYDEHGRKVSETRPNVFGTGYTTYDAHGKKIGRSEPGFFGGYTHYDMHGKKTGRSELGFFGNYNNYDAHGKRTSTTTPSFFGFQTRGTFSRRTLGSPAASGCYIATCVYGSYDAPEVMTLRRFRDQVLQKSAAGRLFIRCYYAVSPKLVKRFGQRNWFHRFWRKRLDKMVDRLEHKT